MHLFPKQQAQQFASRDKDWRILRSKAHPELYMVWSKRSDHYVEFDSLDGWIDRLEDDNEQAGKEAYSGTRKI
jgi:hypothetical protein